MPGRKKSSKKRKSTTKASGYVIPPLSPVKTRSTSSKVKSPVADEVATPPLPAVSCPPVVESAPQGDSTNLVHELKTEMDARFDKMETAFTAGLSQVSSGSNSTAAAKVDDSAPSKSSKKKSKKLSTRVRSVSPDPASSLESTDSSSSSSESESESEESTSRSRSKKKKRKGKYTTRKYLPKKSCDKSITYERMVLANVKMALSFYKKEKNVKGLLQHIVLIAEKAESGTFTAAALSDYDESVKSLAMDFGLKAFKRADPSSIVKHLSYEGTIAAERARQATRGGGRRRHGRGQSGNLYACYKYNSYAEGCKGGCGYRHICSSCGSSAHLADDCPKKSGGNQGGRK